MRIRLRFRFGLRAFVASAYTLVVLAASLVTYLSARDGPGSIPVFLLVDLPLRAVLPVPDLPKWGSSATS
ncbi:hypothetical protein GCM10022221_46910 [Actinocorallia aurea]